MKFGAICTSCGPGTPLRSCARGAGSAHPTSGHSHILFCSHHFTLDVNFLPHPVLPDPMEVSGGEGRRSLREGRRPVRPRTGGEDGRAQAVSRCRGGGGGDAGDGQGTRGNPGWCLSALTAAFLPGGLARARRAVPMGE